MSKDPFDIIVNFLTVIGFLLMTYGISSINAYKEGQLDYQRGIIKYELTETGYKDVRYEQ